MRFRNSSERWQDFSFVELEEALVVAADLLDVELVDDDQFTGQSVMPAALALPNVVVLQSLSKAAGIAALRLGFAIGHPTIVDRLRRVTGPYDINTFAVVAGTSSFNMNVVAGALRYRYSANPPLNGTMSSAPMTSNSTPSADIEEV